MKNLIFFAVISIFFLNTSCKKEVTHKKENKLIVEEIGFLLEISYPLALKNMLKEEKDTIKIPTPPYGGDGY